MITPLIEVVAFPSRDAPSLRRSTMKATCIERSILPVSRVLPVERTKQFRARAHPQSGAEPITMNVKRILMPTDFSKCADAALDHALFLARKYGAELHLLHVLQLHLDDYRKGLGTFPSMEEIYDRLEVVARSDMGRRLEARSVDVLTVEERLRRGIAAAPEIASYVDEEDIDLVVIGSHGRRGVRRFVLGSVAEEVARIVNCPVLVIRAQETTRELGHPKRLLVPFDFSGHSEAALMTALQLVADDQAQIDLVHVLPPPIVTIGYGTSLPIFSDAEASERTRSALEDRVASISVPVECPIDCHVLHGNPGGEIIRFAESRGTDLVVIGSQGLAGMSRLLLGSVAEKVMRRTECPVLVVRAAQSETVTEKEAQAS